MFNTITLSVATSNYVISGNSITLYAGLTNNGSSPPNSINCRLVLATDQTFASGGTILNLNGAIDNAGKSLQFSGRIISRGVISGSGSLAKIGASGLNLLGTNTYTGETTVSEGSILAGNPSCLGATSAGTTVLTGGSLLLEADLAEPITLQGILQNFFGTNTLTGALTLAASNSFIQVLPNSALIFSNVLSGT